LSRAVNLYQAALAAPLRPKTRRDVEVMLAGFLDELSRTALNGSSRLGAKVQAGRGWRHRHPVVAAPVPWWVGEPALPLAPFSTVSLSLFGSL
jgi:hypothetical protein